VNFNLDRVAMIVDEKNDDRQLLSDHLRHLRKAAVQFVAATYLQKILVFQKLVQQDEIVVTRDYEMMFYSYLNQTFCQVSANILTIPSRSCEGFLVQQVHLL
jgi:hypothetical protein